MSSSTAPQQSQIRYLNPVTIIVTLLVPFVLILGAVRILLTPAYLIFEYNTPYFPADRFGFDKEDRLYWAYFAVDYLVNDEDISYLGELRFPEGERVPPQSCQYMIDCSQFYNDQELEHMLDVKNVVQAALKVWYLSIAGILIMVIWAYFSRTWGNVILGLNMGGWLTGLIILTILLFVLIAFGFIFVLFHQVFFESGTWTFLYSDSLIRLFPERFWRDTFLAVGILAGGAGLLLALLTKKRAVK